MCQTQKDWEIMELQQQLEKEQKEVRKLEQENLELASEVAYAREETRAAEDKLEEKEKYISEVRGRLKSSGNFDETFERASSYLPASEGRDPSVAIHKS